jgi:membrane protein YdbS with pleckstrin-like domain
MTGIEIIFSVLLGLVVNEMSDISPWVARRLVVWSAYLRYGDSVRGTQRSEELEAVINDRPGKLLKLGTGVKFAGAALIARLQRLTNRGDEDGGPLPDEVLSLGRRTILEDEPSTGVARFLFPTEKFRGEWRRHWIFLVKSWLVTATLATLSTIIAVERFKPHDRVWTIVIINAAAVLFAVYRLAGWYWTRFVITDKRLMFSEGVFTRRVGMVPLLRVTEMDYTQTALGRLLDYATFRIDSTSSRRNRLRRIVDLPHPNELYLRIIEETYEPEAVEAKLAARRHGMDDDEEFDGLYDGLADAFEDLEPRHRLLDEYDDYEEYVDEKPDEDGTVVVE